MILTPSPVTNCHTFLDSSPLEHDLLHGWPPILHSNNQAKPEDFINDVLLHAENKFSSLYSKLQV